VEAVDRRPFVFGRKKVGVARRPSAMVDAGGVGGAGAFGALASTEEEVVEEEVNIIFLPPKPKVKEKEEKKKEKTAVMAAADATDEAVESDSRAAEATAGAVAVRDDKLRDLEVLTIGSDPIDKTSEETIAEKAAADAAEKVVCPLVAAMVTTGEKDAKEIATVTMVAAEEAAAATAEEAVAAAGRQQQRIRTKGLLEMRAMQQDRKKTAEKAEDKAERLKKSLVESMW
jgi:hypothetical protein